MRTTYTVRNGITVNDEARGEDAVVVVTSVALLTRVVLLPMTAEVEGTAADVSFIVAVSISVWVMVVSTMVLMTETGV